MIALFVTVSIFTCIALWAVIRGLVRDAYKEGYRHGFHKGTYDASVQQVDTEAFFRGLGHSDKTQFPHRN